MTSATLSDLDRVVDVGNSQIYIRCAGGQPPRYVVDIKGIDQDSLSHQVSYDNDVRNAIPARMGGVDHDVYARDIEAAIRANVPAGSEIKLVGHSYGSIAALNVASDPGFNTEAGASGSSGYRVVDVVTTGIDAPDMAAKVPPGTNVIMAVDRNDPVASLIRAGDSGSLTSDLLKFAVAPAAAGALAVADAANLRGPVVTHPSGNVTRVEFSGSEMGLDAHNAHVSGVALDDPGLRKKVPELGSSEQRFPVVLGPDGKAVAGSYVDLPEREPGAAESLMPTLPTIGLAVGAVLVAPVVPIVGAGMAIAAVGSYIGGLFDGVRHAGHGDARRTVGADAEDLAVRADGLRTVADRLGALVRDLQYQFRAVPWHGHDAQQFQDRWTRTVVPALLGAEEFIADKAGQLAANAQQQREVSGR